MTLSGKVVLVTGSSRGIGRAIVEGALADGASVVLTGRDEQALTAAVATLPSDRAVGLPGNVTDDQHLRAAVQVAVERFGRCDVLVNNAGQNAAAGALMDVEMGRVDKTWAVNLRAPLVATRAAWELWMRDNGGSVVNVASIGGLVPTPFLGAYNVAKAAVLHLTRQLAHELAPHVRVNAVAPGVVQTQFSAPLLSMVPHGWDQVHPVGRLGTEQDVARAVLFLADPDSSWISGTTLTVDGGATGATTPFAVLS